MDFCFSLMLICGLIAALQGTDGFSLPRHEKYQKLKANVHRLQEHYNTLDTEWVGNSVFGHHLEHLPSRRSCTCQSMMLDGMLNAYEKIFTNILNNSKKEELKSSVNDILSEVENLRQKYREEHKLWRDLQDIHSVKEENPTIRGTALNEFLMVFNEANKTVTARSVKKIQT